MTGMLASVNSLEEAELVMEAKADIIDLKEPKAGSLGSLSIELVKEILTVVKGKCLTSATIGDLPMEPELICFATQAMAETGVDYVKIGIFPNGDLSAVLDNLSSIAIQFQLIAVLFADRHPDLKIIDKIKAANFSGVMLDTLDKSKGSLTRIMSLSEIARFVNYAKSLQLICGLAGSLRTEDISLLLPLQPGYLGFRGALCDKHDRKGQINVCEVQKIRKTIAEIY